MRFVLRVKHYKLRNRKRESLRYVGAIVSVQFSRRGMSNAKGA